MKPLRFACALSVLIFVPLCAVPASAGDAPDETSLEAARDKFRQALSLQTGGDWAGALSLLRQVGNIKMTPQVRFNMALCQENLGELVAALGDYELAASEADDSGAADVAAEAVQRLESLQSRIPKLVIERAEGADLARVRLDGVGVGAAVLGKPMPVDPGQHVVEASAPGFAPFRESFQIGEKERKFVRVTLRALTPAAAEAVSDEALGGAPGPPQQAARPRVLPFVVGGIGAASLVASGVFYALRASTIDELDAACGAGRDRCPPGSQDTETRGRTYTTLANVTLGVGVVGLGAGVILFLSGPKEKSAAGIRPVAPGAQAGMSFVGRF